MFLEAKINNNTPKGEKEDDKMKNMTAQEYADEMKIPYTMANSFLKVLVTSGLIKVAKAEKAETPEGAEVKGVRGRKAEVYAIPDTIKVNMFGLKSIETKARPSAEERAAAEKAETEAKAARKLAKATERLAKAKEREAEKVRKAEEALAKANGVPAEATA